MEPEIDLDLLAYLLGKGSSHIEEAVAGTGYLPRTVVGLVTFLLDIDGDVDLLTAKQKITFDRFLKPLLFAVPCRGLSGPESCRGTGLIEQNLLLKSYRDNEFKCSRCHDLSASQDVD